MINKFIANGRTTKDIDVRYTSNNVAVANFTLAVARNFTNTNGEYESDFLNCIAYKNTAELLKKHIHKGDLIGIEGRVQTRSYDNADNKKVYVTEIVVDRIDFLNVKKDVAQNEEQTFNPSFDLNADEIQFGDEELPF